MLTSRDFGNRRGDCRDYSTKMSKGNSGRTLSKEPKRESYKRGTKAECIWGQRKEKGWEATNIISFSPLINFTKLIVVKQHP